ncbi:MAG: hypothetical protein JJU20_01905 [Opitutales bacterium]|nr:hypothetical protein [Opitutales bacterium]
MKRTIKTLIALAAMLGSSAAAFGGLLGVNYYGAGIGYGQTWFSNLPDLEGYGAGVGVNHNLLQEADYAIDLTAGYTYTRGSGLNIRSRGHAVSTSAVIFTEIEGGRPFFSVDTGWSWNRSYYHHWRSSDDSWFYGWTGGMEFEIAENWSLAPYVSWTRWDSYRHSEWSGGVHLHHWLDENLGIGGSYSLTEGPDKSALVTLEVNFRY